jgi:hypothetical protein
MRLFKKVLSVAAAIALVAAAVPSNAFAATDAVDFEDGKVPASIHIAVKDDGTVDGDPSELSVVDLNGSKVLKITPTAKGTPKLIFDVTMLVGEENVGAVKGIEYDLAIEKPTTDPLWNGGCVGAGNYAKGTWTNGKEWSIQDDQNQLSAFSHVSTKMTDGQGFEDPTDAFFMFMNWSNSGSVNYIDNIKLLDADGNAIPLAAPEAAAEEAATPKTGVPSYGIYFLAGAAFMLAGAIVIRRRKSIEA